MISKQRGMVLPITITMIIILTLIVLSLMQAVFLYLKVSNNLISNHEKLYELETIAKQIIKSNNKLKCITSEQDPNILASLLLQNNGCLINYNSITISLRCTCPLSRCHHFSRSNNIFSR